MWTPDAATLAVEHILQFGGKKHGREIGEFSSDIDAHLCAALRHLSQAISARACARIQSRDEETGHLHASHAAARLAIVIELIKREGE